MPVLNDASATPKVDDLIVTDEISVRHVAFDAPWDWLGGGWRDMWTEPGVSLAYGALFAFAAAALAWGTTQAGVQSVILALAGGFLLIGPLAAVGLYEKSRCLEAGQPFSLPQVIGAVLHPRGQLGFFGVLLLLIFMVWMQLAFLLFMLFSGSSAIPPASEFVPMLMFTKHGLGLMVVGTIVGAALAAVTFAVSALSVPLLMVKDVDIVTAVSTSLRAVAVNPKAMALWAALIAGFMALGIATLFVGLAIAFPLVGHATWHAFRSIVVLKDGPAKK